MYHVVNPVHEIYHEGETRESCVQWIEDFAASIKQAVIETGPDTYRAGDFNLYIFEELIS